MRILVDSRWFGTSGIGRYAAEILNRMPADFSIELLRSEWGISNPISPVMLGRQIRGAKVDTFWSPGFMPPLLPLKPSVVTIHDLIHLHYGTHFHKAYYNFVIKRLIKGCKYILTDSEYSRNEILNWSGLEESKVISIPLGVSDQFSLKGSAYDPGFPFVLYVGNRRAYKNLTRLIVAFCIASIGTETQLLLSGEYDAQLVEVAKKYGCENRIQFIGVLKDDDLACVYRGASLVAYLSLYEGFGLPPLEAMACGSPVICSNLTSIPEVVGNAAILVDPLDIDQIASAIRDVLTNSKLKKELSKKGVLQAAQYSWQNTAKLTWEILRKSKHA